LDAAVDIVIKLGLLLVLLGLTCLSSTWALLRGLNPRGVVLVGSATLAIFFGALFFMIQTSAPAGSTPLFQKYFDEAWDHQTQWLKTQGVPEDRVSQGKVFYQKYIVQSFPAWLAVNCLVVGLLAYYLSSALLSKVTTRVTKAIAFREWLIPESLVFGLILGAILKLGFKEDGFLDILGNNLLVFFVGLYGLGGLSIVSFFLNKWRVPAFFRILCYLPLFYLMSEFICTLGVLDVWFDFRKIKTAAPEQTA